MLKAYLNQTALHEATQGINDRALPTYGAPQNIICRKQEKVKTAFAADKQLTYVETVYYTEYPVRAGDKLDGEIIKVVSAWYDLYGKVCGYKAVM